MAVFSFTTPRSLQCLGSRPSPFREGHKRAKCVVQSQLGFLAASFPPRHVAAAFFPGSPPRPRAATMEADGPSRLPCTRSSRFLVASRIFCCRTAFMASTSPRYAHELGCTRKPSAIASCVCTSLARRARKKLFAKHNLSLPSIGIAALELCELPL
jgi:hypothetical protein